MKYSIQEIIRFAVEIEKEGALFYGELAKKVSSEDVKKIFLNIKNDELEHQKTYEELLSSLGEDENEYKFHLENEYTAYLHSFIEKSIFDKDKTEDLSKVLSNQGIAIDYAVGKEEGSIDYYTNLKSIVPEDYVSVVEKIIEEEKGHVDKLLKIKNKI